MTQIRTDKKLQRNWVLETLRNWVLKFLIKIFVFMKGSDLSWNTFYFPTRRSLDKCRTGSSNFTCVLDFVFCEFAFYLLTPFQIRMKVIWEILFMVEKSFSIIIITYLLCMSETHILCKFHNDPPMGTWWKDEDTLTDCLTDCLTYKATSKDRAMPPKKRVLSP